MQMCLPLHFLKSFSVNTHNPGNTSQTILQTWNRLIPIGIVAFRYLMVSKTTKLDNVPDDGKEKKENKRMSQRRMVSKTTKQENVPETDGQ